MKTKKVGKKMTLNKKTVADLDSINMNEVKGGYSATRTSCNNLECICDSRRWCTCPGPCGYPE